VEKTRSFLVDSIPLPLSHCIPYTNMILVFSLSLFPSLSLSLSQLTLFLYSLKQRIENLICYMGFY
jgi:hypothetical protein